MDGQVVVSDGRCGSGATPVGSYFMMLDPGGNPVDNGDSPCGDKAATPVRAGADGLTPGRMQPFAGSPGASRAIIAPTTFFGSPFAVATERTDKQSGAAVEAPTVRETGESSPARSRRSRPSTTAPSTTRVPPSPAAVRRDAPPPV